MQIPPSHELLHALGTAPSPMPVRPAAATITAEPVTPGREATPSPRVAGTPDRPAAPPRPGARVNILV